MDGRVVEYSAVSKSGGILGEDQRRYGFAAGDWHSAGAPEPGAAVRFVTAADRVTQIYRLMPVTVDPLTPGEAIEAVYRTAWRGGAEDLFGAPVRWTGFIVPALIFLVLRTLQLVFGGGLGMVAWQKVTLVTGLLLLVIVVAATLITLAIAVGVAALLGRGMGEPRRVANGALAYVWMQAVLLQPGIAVMRMLLDPRDPTVVFLLLLAATVVLVIGAGRVVRAGFKLGGAPSGVFIVVASGAASWVIDRLLGEIG